MNDWRESYVRLKPTKGWLFDVYPLHPSKMIAWIIAENGERVRLVDNYACRIFVSGEMASPDRHSEIEDNLQVSDYRFVEKYADFTQTSKKRILEIEIGDYRKAPVIAGDILKHSEHGKSCLHNVDIPIAQSYLFEKDVFPLAHVTAIHDRKSIHYDALDSAESVDYEVPRLRSMQLLVESEKEDLRQRFTDKIAAISLQVGNRTLIIDKEDEADAILELVRVVKKEDPDLIFTYGGDSFLFSYLAYRALENGILNQLVLSREDIPLRVRERQGKAFFSYGRVYHKAPTCRLYGRIHIDKDNTFIYSACGLEGLIETSRTCRVPLHKTARASIGSIMSSLQLYIASKNDILIPWKKREPESFKSAWNLLVADRGGFIFEPKLGFHTDVVEVDFTSMFPMLMLTRNISAETVLCRCCPNSMIRVPELGYNICEKRRGIVPKTLSILLKKRMKYKNLMKETANKRQKHIYNMRQAALKWILVTCFGYLGYRNARFGNVDAHIAVCAFARDTLLKAAHEAEQHGFEVLHGIVDSLWLKKHNVIPEEVGEFCRIVSHATGVPLNSEGRYRWIVFLPSKILEGTPVLNRYYGAFEDGKIKIRGIEARRADTPRFICNAQVEMVKALARSGSSKDFSDNIRQALDILREYSTKLISNRVSNQDLLITKRLSKSPHSYTQDIFQAIAARQMKKAGFDISGGQTVRYLVVNSKTRTADNRVLAAELLRPNTRCDTSKYLDMLISSAETLFGVFGYTKNRIRTEVLHGKRQMKLKS